MTSRPCILLALVIAAGAPSSAEARRPVKVRDQVGEKARKARETAAADGQADAQRPRTRRTGFSGKRRGDTLKLRVDVDRVRGFDDPRTKGTCTLDLVKGDLVVMLGRGHQGWILVETEAGDSGWIPAAAVTDGGRFVADPRRPRPDLAAAIAAAAAEPAPAPAPAEAPAHRRAAAAPPSRIAASLVATAGAETFALRQADAIAIATGPLGAVAAGARVGVASGLWLGVAGNAGFSRGELTYFSPTEASQPMATRELVLDASAELGWGRAWSIAVRGGYHHASLTVESERAEPMLAGERIGGATVGVGGTAPIGRRIALAAAIDVMPAGAHAPAEAEVAAATAVRGAWARGTLTVRLAAHLVAALAYRGGAVDAALPDGTTRSDRTHAVTAGLGVAW